MQAWYEMGNAKQYGLGRFATAAAYSISMIVLYASSSLSQDIVSGVAEKGASLADRFCSNCHLLGDGAGGSVPPGIPRFRGIANNSG